MKKITLLFSALIMALMVNAQNPFNNPLGTDGRATYLWDCEKNDFATDRASNDFEIDQTITFAVDVSGTPLEEWLQNSPVGTIRSIGFDSWSQFGGNIDGRFARVRGNIYAVDLNFAQFANFRGKSVYLGADGVSSFDQGVVTEIYMNIFGFAYNENTAGLEWYSNVVAGLESQTLPYTGTKTSIQFWNDDYPNPGLFINEYPDWGGYAYPCAADKSSATLVESFTSDSPVVGYEYYSILGAQLSEAPVSGIYIVKAIKADGSSESYKAIK